MDRRHFLGLSAAAGANLSLPFTEAQAARFALRQKLIPASGQKIPILGMGTWLTFNVGADEAARAQRVKVLETFFAGGGGVIDSSPMYGLSEEMVGYCLAKLPRPRQLFTATKVWTVSKFMGIGQMETSQRLWGQEKFDLIQIHNLLDWQTHLETLNEWKAQGRLRYSGITTSHGRRHDEFADIMKTKTLDFAQFTYNIADREVEKRLLPLAADRGMAVIINRPFKRGTLIEALKRKPLPQWASEIAVKTWPQFLLKFILSHPAVTCAIPATTNPAHMFENLDGARRMMPDAKMRERMVRYVEDV